MNANLAHRRPDHEMPIEQQVPASFESVNMDQYLKHSHVYRHADMPAHAWFVENTGGDFFHYYRRHGLGMVYTWLRVEVEAVPVIPKESLRARFQTTLGHYPVREGKAPRYGGMDTMSFEGMQGEVARMSTSWVWFQHSKDVWPHVLREAPPEFLDTGLTLPFHQPAPEVEGEFAHRFVWTRRETDLNQHVNSMAYFERAENALFHIGLTPAAVGAWDVWYLNPAFPHQHTDAYVEVRDGRALVRMAAANGGETSTVMRIPLA